LRRLLALVFGIPDLAIHDPADVDWATLPDECVLQIHWHRTPAFLKLLEQHRFAAVVLARHPLDVLLSILHFAPHEPRTARWLNGEGGDESAIWGAMPCSSAFQKYALGSRATALLSVSREWWYAPDCRPVHYEDLVADPARELQRLVRSFDRAIGHPLSEAIAATTLARLRAAGPCRHHFWQGKPGLWKKLLPDKEADQIAAAQALSFTELGYDCDPDPELEWRQADAHWAKLNGVEDERELEGCGEMRRHLLEMHIQLAEARRQFIERGHLPTGTPALVRTVDRLVRRYPKIAPLFQRLIRSLA
jgi:hypothetical protein